MLERLAGDGVADPPFASIDGARQVDVLVRHRCAPDALDDLPHFPARESTSAIRGVPPLGDATEERVVAAEIPWEGLEDLTAPSCVFRVEPARMPGSTRALEETTRSTGIRAAHYRPGEHVDGFNSTIALLDSPVDVLHPAFFRPDAGRYRWIDVDEDEEFTPGTDAVDLDRDGVADRNEILRVLDATTAVERGDEFRNADGTFQADRDWLYMDVNDDGARNAGRAEGFREYDPAYAEPTFVADDVDHDTSLEVGEPLYRLGTSKIERVVRDDETYRRGDNLIAAASDLPPRSTHGTAVAGILVGGQLGFHRRVGVAPRAKLIVVGYPYEMEDSQPRHLRGLRVAEQQGADVFLSEWTNPFTRPIDGSTNLEAAMAEARDDRGLAQVVPVGNLNRSRKHLERRLEAGEPSDLSFEVPENLPGDDDGSDDSSSADYIFGTLQWRGETALGFEIALPNGPVKPIPIDGSAVDLDAADVYSVRDRTPRGTRVLTFYIRSPEDSTTGLPAGQWRFIAESADTSTTLYGRITDSRTGWDRGVGWSEPTADVSTVSYPATGDAAFGVGAHAGRSPTDRPDVDVGDLRDFSGRGPRIDGEPVVDIAAPDNPFVPVAATEVNLEAGWRRGGFRMFGGTSGAAPHVAGSFALFAESHPDRPPDFYETRLAERAGRTDLDPQPESFPHPGWGAGELATHRALFGSTPDPNTPPEARLTIGRDGTRVVFDATESSDPDGDELAFRFDFDHDGDWDTGWREDGRPERPLNEVVASSSDPAFARLEVRDLQGARSGALAELPRRSASGPGDTGMDTGREVDATSRSGGRHSRGCSAGTVGTPLGRIPLGFGLLATTCLVGWRRSND
jgi:subtilisin family serine protease